MKQTPVVFLLGATATGKSDLALRLAERFDAEIVSIDSALIYRDMDIGTAKPNTGMRAQVPHHLLDIVTPAQRYDAGRFRSDALAAIEQIHARGRLPLFVGGTMMYYKVLTQGLHDLPRADVALRAQMESRAAREGWPALHAELARIDPQSAQRLQPTDAQRIQRALEVFHVSGTPWSAVLEQAAAEPLPYRSIVCALAPADRAVLHQRIAQRFDHMLRAGLVEEVEALKRRYDLRPELPSMRCVGYRQVWQYLTGAFDRATLREQGVAATRQLAKRQLTWLRSLPSVELFECFAPDVERRLGERIERALGA